MTSGGGWNKFQAATFSCVDALRLSKLHNLKDLTNEEHIIIIIIIVFIFVNMNMRQSILQSKTVLKSTTRSGEKKEKKIEGGGG